MTRFGTQFEPSERARQANNLPVIRYDIAYLLAKYQSTSETPLINLAVSDPDAPPSTQAVKSMLLDILQNPASHLWTPSSDNTFQSEVIHWLSRRFGIKNISPDEILPVNGAFHAMDLMLSAYSNRGDKVLIPNPGYEHFAALLLKHDLKPVYMPLAAKNGFVPDLDQLANQDLSGVKMMILNYPHNPTGVFAPERFLRDAVQFAKKNGIIILHDFDNPQVYYGSEPPKGILQIDGAKDVAVQIHSMAKAFNMSGLRTGFMVGDSKFLNTVLTVKLMDMSATYPPFLKAMTAALQDDSYLAKLNQQYKERLGFSLKHLKALGGQVTPPQGTSYLWFKVPEGFTSYEFFLYVLKKTRVAVTPGVAFGSGGEGYVRLALVQDKSQLDEAFRRFHQAGIRFDMPRSAYLDVDEVLQEDI